MQKTALLLILGLIFVSACLNTNTKKGEVGVSEVTTPDVYLKIESVPTEVTTGKSLNLIFTLENMQDKDLENVNMIAFDQCLFSGTSVYPETGTLDLKPNRTERWTWKWTAGQTQFDRDCTIKFKTDYESNMSVSQDVIVLTETEFVTRELQGTLAQLQPTSSSSSSPISISMEFSENQPFQEKDKVLMEINYENTGGGFIDNFEPGDITIEVPTNLEYPDCGISYTYDSSSRTLTLARTLTFISNKAPTTSCKFNTTSEQPVSTKPLTLTANYKYNFDNSIIVKVKR
jgi:hypothetical protein